MQPYGIELELTWVDQCGKAKVNDPYSAPTVVTLFLQQDIGGAQIQMTDGGLEMHEKDSLQRYIQTRQFSCSSQNYLVSPLVAALLL